DVRINGTNRFLLEPLVEARMLQYALKGRFQSVLVLGAASLPSVEMVASFARNVVVVEPEKRFTDAAQHLLRRHNVTVIETSLKEGYARQAPYDCIFVTGAMAQIPSVIASQLAVGGCMLAVLRPSAMGAGRIVATLRLSEDEFETISLADASTPYLAGFAPENGFQF
ncbi:MAG: protein-L-isoaspartate O-methyltransferase, partial [Alphaproteobacteria bacterium]|nr:protein-L-isoaspartate O-methyltransferase [Alphaproteobacteria bacterium]